MRCWKMWRRCRCWKGWIGNGHGGCPRSVEIGIGIVIGNGIGILGIENIGIQVVILGILGIGNIGNIVGFLNIVNTVDFLSIVNIVGFVKIGTTLHHWL